MPKKSKSKSKSKKGRGAYFKSLTKSQRSAMAKKGGETRSHNACVKKCMERKHKAPSSARKEAAKNNPYLKFIKKYIHDNWKGGSREEYKDFIRKAADKYRR